MAATADLGPVLAVSPHLDDAVLSAGAAISALTRAGRRVVVCTVFAGDPVPPLSPKAVSFHAKCGLGDDAAPARRAEDAAAVAALGAEHRHLDFADAIYRRLGDDWLVTVSGAHFDPNLPAEPDVAAAVGAALTDVLDELRPAEVWTCAGIGGHVDHRMTRAVVEQVRGDVELVLWEDLPYAIGTPGVAFGRVRADAGDERDRERKLAAIAHYRSQMGMLFPDSSWRDGFTTHAKVRVDDHGAPELLWHTAD
ncbi:PIG-L family deacetylase [Actinokineospora auranticolor]|uniref:LmbE family N-acetylglucosaminyl deacetylase n=1 Tax=Actinokineospora auranticolor TaxID=155976 RepID=A0A2S6GII8_9PSEU|nr:PIG-L family deacetylase [Actinokineospora auranticolor]PPK65010.1 LmbE family N-acetylglucosaminyl deacetylase [Actinokineospora auranticolor]